MSASASPAARLPSIDRLLRSEAGQRLGERFGRALLTEVLREQIGLMRARLLAGEPLDDEAVVRGIEDDAARALESLCAPRLVAVLNLTGTVLHTNLGRAPLPPEAVDAVARVSLGASNLEMDLARGRRGDRDDHIEHWVCRLTGAEAATVVNNNAAAVLLTLNALAQGRQVPVSRGELIEIGGAFRIPDIMSRAGCTLVEVGTTNRTHRHDFENAIGAETALLMKVHTSNYEVQGFTASVDEQALAEIAHAHDLPMVSDLGSGTLIDLAQFGLPHETTPAETLAAGADLVTFSGDKLLGGPQCGIIAGRRDLVAAVKKNPIKRAMRVDKMTLAALGVVLPMYGDPERLVQRLPALRLLTRTRADIARLARELAPQVASLLGDRVQVSVVECASQIGSGALPVDALPSAALRLVPSDGRGRTLNALAAELRALTTPVLGRVEDGALHLDLRCLEDGAQLLDALAGQTSC